MSVYKIQNEDGKYYNRRYGTYDEEGSTFNSLGNARRIYTSYIKRYHPERICQIVEFELMPSIIHPVVNPKKTKKV